MPYGNPILSPSNAQTFDMLTGKHGALQVRALLDADTFGLFYTPPPDGNALRGETLIATHPNGHSCKELGVWIIAAWDGTRDGARAVAQYQFILDCGGTARSLKAFLEVVNGRY